MVKSALSRISYVCQGCGAVHSKWSGKCEACEGWNTITQEIMQGTAPKGLGGSKKGRLIEFVPLAGEAGKAYPRYVTGIKEFDRVTGGGFVPGSAVLIGGDPGIGKSTILLQAVCALSNKNVSCVYVSGEEAIDQVRMRAVRLGLSGSQVELASATNVRDIVASVESAAKPVSLLVIDSIQTMYIDTIDAAPGTVTQVRGCAQEIIRVAKARGMVVIFVGHVTKEGMIAGPRVLEHMVDTVLYFEGDRTHQFRILRAVKNRFGPTDEIGVFEMAERGLVEVENPSAMMLSQRTMNVAGSAVLAALEGTRPLLVEVQALVSTNGGGGSPRRAVLGWDPNRLAMIVAVLETRCGLQLAGNDIFLNIAGGIRIAEPAADMAVAAALISALKNKPLPPDTVFFGEIGLAGEIRQVAQPDVRLKEASKLGFKQGIVPAAKKKDMLKIESFALTELSHAHELEDIFLT
ncbi:MAG: DNA repair protein RadA [Alphaproteobacteria bacterium]